MRVCLREKAMMYIVTRFTLDHNHDFVPLYQSYLIPANRHVEESFAGIVIALRKVSVKTGV